MSRFCIFVGMTLLGWVGWWLGRRFGVMTGFLMSGAGNIAGVVLGYRFYRAYLR